MSDLIALVQAHWGVVALGAYTTGNFLLSAIANSLPAPTAQSSVNYTFWFRMVNYSALNWNRAKNIARIEDSPNFIPAAEAYYQKKLAENGKGN